jgi:hypothetical protein
MGKSLYRPMPSRKAVVDEKAKIAKLRDLRLARDSARREAGTWGDVSVGEITHEPSGEVFVLSWKGEKSPDLETAHRSRLSELSIAEQERLRDWLARHHVPDFKQSLIGWSLSRGEARRAKQARIEELRASGHDVINDAPVDAPVTG